MAPTLLVVRAVPTLILLPTAVLLGLVIGSFLNVVIHRVPRGESVVTPASRCPACHRAVRARHNIPVLGWLVLRGRCANCGQPISVRYPLVELATAVLFGAVTLRVVELGLLSALPAYLYLTAVGVALAVIDIDYRRLPNAIVLPSYPVLAVLLALSAVWQHDGWALARAATGAVVLLGGFLALAFAQPAGMGLGDVKLAGILGGLLAYLSWSAVVVGTFAGFVLGAVTGVAMITMGRATRKTTVPFGPFMIAGALLAIFATPPITTLYTDVMLALGDLLASSG